MKVLIAGGGTGGHLFPGIALAEEVTRRAPHNAVLFVGTERGLESRVLPEVGFALEKIEVAGLKGTSLRHRFAGFGKLPGAMRQSFRILRRFRPDVAVGVGGYASGPVILAAWMMGVPTAILEQNTVPGVTNRILARLARAVYVMFDVSGRYFPPQKVRPLGNPIRRQMRAEEPTAAAEPNDRFNVLVLGGSQGAHTLNLRMVEAAPRLAAEERRLRIVHQTGTKDEELVRRGYEEAGLEAEVHAFIQQMSNAYRRADLVVCRAGATTLAEVMVARKAAILVPYPYAADNHQELNGQSMVDAGAAVMLVERDLDGRRLADEILALSRDPDRLRSMGEAAGRTGRPEAASRIVDALTDIVEGEAS